MPATPPSRAEVQSFFLVLEELTGVHSGRDLIADRLAATLRDYEAELAAAGVLDGLAASSR